MEHFFSPNSGGDLRSDAHQSQIFGGDADVDHTQIIGGDTDKLLGGYIPHPPRVLAPLDAVEAEPRSRSQSRVSESTDFIISLNRSHHRIRLTQLVILDS